MLFCEKITTEKKLDPLGSIPKAHLLAFNNKVAKIRSSKEVEAGKTASSTKKRSVAFAWHSGPKFSKKSVNYVKVNGICEFENICWQKNMKEVLYISQHNYIFFRTLCLLILAFAALPLSLCRYYTHAVEFHVKIKAHHDLFLYFRYCVLSLLQKPNNTVTFI